MGLLLNLYLGHLLGDFLFQPGRLVAAKREGALGICIHTIIIAACTSVVMWSQLVRYPLEVGPVIVLIAGVHFVIEQITILAYMRTPTRGLYTFVLDQALHILSMVLLVWLYNGTWVTSPPQVLSTSTFGVPVTLVQLAAFNALLTVTLFGRIFVFEMGNTVLNGEGAKGRLLSWDAPRLAGLIERGGALVAALWLGPISPLVTAAALLGPFVPRVVHALTRAEGPDRTRNLVEAASGACICVGAWAGVVVVGLLSGSTVSAGAQWWAPALFS